VIYQGEGPEFALTKRGSRGMITDAGKTLDRSDLLQTGAGGFVEIQLLPSGDVIKISENSSLVYNGYDASGRFTDLSLLYGRIRVLSGGGDAVVVRVGNTSVRVAGGDTGIDYVVTPQSASPILQVYNFRGAAEAHPYLSDARDAVQVITLDAGESLTVEIRPPLIATTRRPLDRGIIDFWIDHDFSGVPPLPMPVSILPALAAALDAGGDSAAPEPAPLEPPAAGAGLQKIDKWKRVLLISGLAVAAAGAVAQSAASFGLVRSQTDSVTTVVYIGGLGVLGIGLGAVLTGALLPAPP